MNRIEHFPMRRLLALGALSVGLHLATLAWLNAHRQPRQRPAGAALSVRLLAPPAPAASAAPLPAPSAAPSAPRPRPAASTRSAAPPAPGSAVEAALPGADGALYQPMPGRYNVRLPPPVVLSFDVSEGPGLTPREAPSRLIWQAGEQHYGLRFENVPDNYGGPARTLTSEGGVNDGGIAPDSALEQQDGAADARTSFEREAGRIELASGASVELNTSTQDMASLLMQLAGMGLADPDQMQGTLAFEVTSSAGYTTVQFDVSGPEQLDTPMGMLSVLHLTQQTRPGEIRLEVWLAPALSWYPVQLQTSGPTGVIALQRLRAATASAP
jgi:hypothetical protein